MIDWYGRLKSHFKLRRKYVLTVLIHLGGGVYRRPEGYTLLFISNVDFAAIMHFTQLASLLQC